MMNFFTHNLLWSQAPTLVLAFVLLFFFGLRFNKFWCHLAVIFLLGTLFFFRNPTRTCSASQTDECILICPADGTVVDVCLKHDNMLEGTFAQRVSIFLSPFDVHVQWIPTTGVIKKITHVPGAYVCAFLAKSSLLNEHNDVLIKNKFGAIMVRQIAGFVARRICCWVTENQVVYAGQKFGMIRFGSRVDVFLPATVELNVGVGQRVVGGQTVLGRWTEQKQ